MMILLDAIFSGLHAVIYIPVAYGLLGLLQQAHHGLALRHRIVRVLVVGRINCQVESRTHGSSPGSGRTGPLRVSFLLAVAHRVPRFLGDAAGSTSRPSLPKTAMPLVRDFPVHLFENRMCAAVAIVAMIGLASASPT
jgi:hypothetical protein